MAADLKILITAQNLARSALRQVEQDLGRVNQQASFASRGFSGLQGVVGTGLKVAAGAGAAALGGITAGLVAGTAAFGNFQQGMNEVFTLLPGISDSAMRAMEGQVKSFANEFKVLPQTVVPALYQALSAGVPPDNVFSFLETAQKAAVGGVTDLTTAVDGISSVVNAYGADVLDAARASDVMFTAVRLGKTNFEQLSGSLFNVIPAAASMGVSFEDVSASLARLTAQGTPTSVATTQLRQLFVEASKDSTNLGKAINAVAGDSFTNLIAKGMSSAEILQMVRSSMPDDEFRNLFGSVEAAGAALGITGPQYEAFVDTLDEMKNSAGATDAAFATMDKGINRLKAQFMAFGQTALIEIGQRVAPYLERLGEQVGAMLPGAMTMLTTALDQGVVAFDALVVGVQQSVGWLTQMWASVTAVAGPVISLVGQFVSWKDVLGAVGIVVASIVLPALWGIVTAAAPVIAIFVGLVAGVALLRNAWENNWGGIQEKTQAVFDAVQPLFARLQEYMTMIAAGDWSGLTDAVFSDVSSVLSQASATISAFDWADWIDGVLEWGTYIGSIAWDAFISALAWTSDIVGAVDWAAFITTLSDWATAIGTVAWDVFITLLDWQAYIWQLEWSAFVSALTWTADIIGKVNWPDFIEAVGAWTNYIEALSWQAFVSALTWGAEYIQSLDWAGFVATLSDWGTWISSLDWTSIITTAIDWATWIPALAWNSFVNLLDWGFIAVFAWADFVMSLDWASFIDGVLNWGDQVSEFDWGEWVTGALDWGAYIVAFTWESFVDKLEWPLIAEFAWSEWIADFEWPTLPTFDWDSWIADFAWPTLPTFRWSEWIADFTWPSLPEFKWSDWIPRFTWPSLPTDWWRFGLGGDQRNAAGTPFFTGGMTLVGERGPEMVFLPRGSRIENAERTASMGGDMIVNIGPVAIYNDMDVETLSWRILQKVQERRPR